MHCAVAEGSEKAALLDRPGVDCARLVLDLVKDVAQP